MFWFIAIFVGTLALSLLRPTQKQTTKPAGLSEINAPIASEDADLAWLFGTRDLYPNCTWYGHLKTKAIKSSGGKK